MYNFSVLIINICSYKNFLSKVTKIVIFAVVNNGLRWIVFIANVYSEHKYIKWGLQKSIYFNPTVTSFIIHNGTQQLDIYVTSV